MYAPDEMRQPVESVPKQQHDDEVEKLDAIVKSSACLKFEDKFSQYRPGYVEYLSILLCVILTSVVAFTQE